jgi:hypothetical protein
MAYIATWLNEELQSRQADMVVDETLWELQQRSKWLDQFVETKMYDNRNFLAYITKQINTMASVVAPNGAIPSTRKGQFRKITAESFKVGLRHDYDEEDQWELRDAIALAEARGITVQNMMGDDGKVIEGSNNSLAALLFGNLSGLVRSVGELLEYMTWQVIQFGAVNYTDPRTGMTVDLDWKDPSLVTAGDHFPSATVDIPWTAANRATANGIQDLYNDINLYYDTNGMAPDAIVMSRKLWQELLQQKSTKEAASSLFLDGGTALQGVVAPERLQAVLETRGIPKVHTFDERTEMDVTPGTSGGNIRFLNADRYCFIKKGKIIKAMGGVIEQQGRSGIYQRTYQDPLVQTKDVSEVIARLLPVSVECSKWGLSRRVL